MEWLNAALVLVGGWMAVILGMTVYLRLRRPSKYTVAFFHPYWYVKT